jgi:hypothetical protein
MQDLGVYREVKIPGAEEPEPELELESEPVRFSPSQTQLGMQTNKRMKGWLATMRQSSKMKLIGRKIKLQQALEEYVEKRRTLLRSSIIRLRCRQRNW